MKTGLSFLVIALILCASPALASYAPSPDNCSAIKEIKVKCYTCDTLQYQGQISVPGEYYNGNCYGRHEQAQDTCARAYGTDKDNTYTTINYMIGLMIYNDDYPHSCKEK